MVVTLAAVARGAMALPVARSGAGAAASSSRGGFHTQGTESVGGGTTVRRVGRARLQHRRMGPRAAAVPEAAEAMQAAHAALPHAEFALRQMAQHMYDVADAYVAIDMADAAIDMADAIAAVSPVRRCKFTSA